MFREIRRSERITELTEEERRRREEQNNYKKIKPETDITVAEAMAFIDGLF